MDSSVNSIKSKSLFKRGTSNPSPPLVEDQLYWCRRRMGPDDSALITEHKTKSQSGTGTQFPGLMTFLKNSSGQSSSTRLTRILDTTRFPSKQLMYGRHISNLNKVSSNGWACPLA
jgi:hypothetical protein